MPRCLLSLLLIGMVHGPVDAATPEWRSKVDPKVLEQAEKGQAEFLVVLGEQADLKDMSRLRTKEARGRHVVERLTAVASRTQAPLLAELAELGVEHRAYWIANLIWVRGGANVLEAVASRGAVRRVEANPKVTLEEPAFSAPRRVEDDATRAVEWNLGTVLADQVWALGYTGSDVVIGGQDTGYDWNHPALKRQYRGWDGLSADHHYNWHDAIHTEGGVCTPDSSEPCDDHGHGTHTMGTMVGDDGGANRIGMSPDARWIGCRNMKQGQGTAASYIECFQWFVAPTDLAGQNPDPARAPHVINNSWYCPAIEGCALDTLRSVVENTRAAGIVVVVSAGNVGSECGTVESPPAIYDAAFSIGATDSVDQIAAFSSRGPVVVDGSQRLKPDVSAPGVDVRSSIPGGAYQPFNGTSMASPHVAGLVALLLDARPELAGQVDLIESLIVGGAQGLTSGEGCGGDAPGDVPNHTYGWGRVDALETIVGDADGDGVSNLVDCQPADPLAWDGPSAVTDLRLDSGGATGTLTELTWPAPAGWSGLRYDVLRATAAADLTGATCVAQDLLRRSAIDPELPRTIFYYVVRTENDCGANPGADSFGLARVTADCP